MAGTSVSVPWRCHLFRSCGSPTGPAYRVSGDEIMEHMGSVPWVRLLYISLFIFD